MAPRPSHMSVFRLREVYFFPEAFSSMERSRKSKGKSMRTMLAFVLLIGTVLGAEQPLPPQPSVQKIEGADKKIPLGELVDLSVNLPSTPAACSTDWVVFELPTGAEKKFKFYRDKKEDSVIEGIVWGAGVEPKELIVVCSITQLNITKEQDKIVQAGTNTVVLRTKITIGDGTAPRPPTPNPIPEPKFPNETLGLSSKIFKSCDQVPAVKRKAGAVALSKSMRGIKASIDAATLKDPVDILKKAAEANRSAITQAGQSRDDWVPVFTVLQDELYSLYQKGTVNSASDFGRAFGEVADAFDAVP